MTGTPSTDSVPPNKDDDKDGRKVLIALLFLLLSFVCIFCASQTALLSINRNVISGNVRSRHFADYGSGPLIALAPLDRDRIIAEIVADNLALLSSEQTPLAGAVIVAMLPQLTPEAISLLPSPTPIIISISPTPTPLPTSQPSPAPSSTPAPPTSSPEPPASPTTAPSPVPTTQVSPTPQTSPSPTVVQPTPTDVLPTPTSPNTPGPSTPTTPPSTATSEPPASATPSNNPPSTGNDSATVLEGSAVTIDVLANDSDSDGTLVVSTLTVISGPSNGSAVISAGQIVYTPNPNFNGSDSFTYRICDNEGGCSNGLVSITVNPQPDPPIAVDDQFQINEDTPSILNVLSNDTDPDGDTLFISAVGSPANGVVQNNGNSLLYTPAANFNGIDVFTYVASDGSLTDTATITVTVLPVNDPPIAFDDTAFTAEDSPEDILVLANDLDIDGDTLTVISVTQPANGSATINGNVVTYTPNPNHNGSDSFTYTISDGEFQATATVTVTIIPINDPPLAQPDAYTMNFGDTLTVPALGVLANDSDVETTVLTAILASGPSSGILSLASNGGFTYTPVSTGVIIFTYRASDGFAQSAATTVTININ